MGQTGIQLPPMPTRVNPASPINSNRPDLSPSSQNTAARGGSLAAGYRELSKNKTLAGRSAARTFNNEPRKHKTPSRLRMVKRLRHKEKFLIWRHIWTDLIRYIATVFARVSPLRLVYSDVRNITSSANALRR